MKLHVSTDKLVARHHLLSRVQQMMTRLGDSVRFCSKNCNGDLQLKNFNCLTVQQKRYHVSIDYCMFYD